MSINYGPINEIKDLAFKYSKPQLGRMAQLGLIDTQKAVLAAMMRERVAKQDAQPPTATVAQDALGLQPPPQQQAQPQPQQMGMQQGQPQQAQPQPQLAQAPAGIESLPAGNVGNYAGGGIVAFDEGGEVPGYARGGFPTMPSTNIQLGQLKGPQEKTIEEIIAEQQGVYEQQGLVNPYEGLMQQQEAKRGELDTRREQAKGEFLMNLGTGLMQAQKGRELAALGTGALKGMADYKDAMKDLRASEEKLDDRIGAFKLADYQAKKTGTDAAIARRDSLRDKVIETENKNIEAQNAVAVEGKKLEMQGFNTAMGYKGTVDAASIRNAAMPDLYKMANSPDMLKSMPNSTFAQRLEAVGKYAHPKDSYNALTSRFNLLNKTIAETNYPLSISYNLAKTDAERKEILDKMNANATRIRTEQQWTASDNARLQREQAQLDGTTQTQGQALPLPPTEAELQKGQLYTTARGPAIWNGTAFVAAPAR